MTRNLTPAPLLRAGLLVDAAGSGAMALLQLALTTWLAEHLRLPHALLLGTGVFMLGYAALTAWMGRAPRLPLALVRLVIVGNVGWALAAVALVLGGALAPAPLGLAFMGVHAASVLGFAALQQLGLARSPAARLTPSV
jgi:hypothetical protein